MVDQFGDLKGVWSKNGKGEIWKEEEEDRQLKAIQMVPRLLLKQKGEVTSAPS